MSHPEFFLDAEGRRFFMISTVTVITNHKKICVPQRLNNQHPGKMEIRDD